MGEGTCKSRPPQRCDRRLRQQAGEDRLGGAAARRTVRRHRNAGGGIEPGRSRSKHPTGVCERVTTGWPDSRTTLRKPGSKNGAIDAGSFMRPGACVSPPWPGGDPSRPDTLKQTDQTLISANLLQTGRAIRFESLDGPLVLSWMTGPRTDVGEAELVLSDKKPASSRRGSFS